MSVRLCENQECNCVFDRPDNTCPNCGTITTGKSGYYWAKDDCGEWFITLYSEFHKEYWDHNQSKHVPESEFLNNYTVSSKILNPDEAYEVLRGDESC